MTNMWISDSKLELAFHLPIKNINTYCDYEIYRIDKDHQTKILIKSCNEASDCSYKCGTILYIYDFEENTEYEIFVIARHLSLKTNFLVACK